MVWYGALIDDSRHMILSSCSPLWQSKIYTLSQEIIMSLKVPHWTLLWSLWKTLTASRVPIQPMPSSVITSSVVTSLLFWNGFELFYQWECVNWTFRLISRHRTVSRINVIQSRDSHCHLIAGMYNLSLNIIFSNTHLYVVLSELSVSCGDGVLTFINRQFMDYNLSVSWSGLYVSVNPVMCHCQCSCYAKISLSCVRSS